MKTRLLGRRALLRAGFGLAWTSGLLAACANQGTDQTPQSTTPVATNAPAVSQVATSRAGPTIRFLQLTLNNDEAQWWQGGIDRFRQRHPAITVTHEPVNWNNFWDRLALYAAANQMPDTLLLTTTHTPQYARLEAIQSLGPYTRLDRALHLDDQWPAARRAVTVAGKGPYLLLYELAPLCIYINKALFKRAGLVDPTARLPEYWTFDEFRQAAVTLSGKAEDGQQWGLSSPLTLWTAADALMRSHGGGFASADNSRTLLDTPESIKTMEQIVELVVKNQVTPPIAAGQMGRLWESGRIAMDIAGPERAFRFRERLRFEWDAAPLPVATRTRLRSNAAQGSGLAMGASSKRSRPPGYLSARCSAPTTWPRWSASRPAACPADRRRATR